MLKIASIKKFSRDEAKKVGDEMNLNWEKVDLEQFVMGLNVELEHGTIKSETNVTDDDPVLTAKIALAHIYECSKYYTYLAQMEKKCKKD